MGAAAGPHEERLGKRRPGADHGRRRHRCLGRGRRRRPETTSCVHSLRVLRLAVMICPLGRACFLSSVQISATVGTTIEREYLNKGSERTSSLCDHALQHAHTALLSLSSLPLGQNPHTIARAAVHSKVSWRTAEFRAPSHSSRRYQLLSNPIASRHTEFSEAAKMTRLRSETRAMGAALLKLPLPIEVHADTRPSSHARTLR